MPYNGGFVLYQSSSLNNDGQLLPMITLSALKRKWGMYIYSIKRFLKEKINIEGDMCNKEQKNAKTWGVWTVWF